MTTHSTEVQDWLARVQHDLVKRVLWAARDYRALGQRVSPGSLVTSCLDDEGNALSALECWHKLRSEAPVALDVSDFEMQLQKSLVAAEQGDLVGVLALEPAFERMQTQTS